MTTRDFLRRWWFALALATGLIFFELAVTGVILWHTPADSRWLGANIFDTQDLAVYLDYLAQGKTAFWLANLYSNLPQVPRVDFFWSLAGLFVRAGLTPIWTHEILRWICTVILAFAVFVTAKRITHNDKEAGIASLLMVSGLSTGWLYDLWMGLANRWTIHSPATADLASEFAISPVLLGGAHIILSLALQLLAIRWIWEAIARQKRKSLVYACLAVLAISLFHPYFIALLGLISSISFLLSLKRGRKAALLPTVIIDVCLIPGAAYHLWLSWADRDFSSVYLHANQLPLDPWYIWLIMLLPFIPATYFILRRKVPKEFFGPDKNTWIWIWIIAAVICILLPFPWKRKYMQGLLPAFVMLTLPFWLWLTSLLWTRRTILPLKFCLLILVAFPFLHLYRTQAVMVDDRFWSQVFYRPKAVFQAWDFMREQIPSSSMVLATDLWTNVWTPAYALRAVWIGHAHATPDYAARLADYDAWTQTNDARAFRDYLSRTPIEDVLASSATETARIDRLIDHTRWQEIFATDGASVWQRQ